MMDIHRIVNGVTVRYLTWLPDSIYLRLRFWGKMGKRLNLKNPQTFSEKIQWLKLYNRRPEYTKMVDKYAVKDYVAGLIGEEYIIPTLGVWDKFDDIDFGCLPDKFVLKTTHGGGGGGVVVCRDKATFNKEEARRKLERSLKADIYKSCREWPYKDVPRRIIAEQMLEVVGHSDLPDYKIFCFNGEPRFIQVIQDRHTSETIDFFSPAWERQEFIGLNPDVHSSTRPIPRPANLDEMLRLARHLAADIPFLRVDLYQVDNRVYFGELTFFPASGFGVFRPDEYNQILGKMLTLRGELGGVNC